MGEIARWMRAHDDQASALTVLRRVWPEGDPQRQRLALRAFAEPLELHMQLEESMLLPAYAELAPRLSVPANGAPHVFEADHERLRGLVARLGDSIGPWNAQRILEQTECSSRLAGALEHHDLRERTWLVPALDTHVPLDVVQRWVLGFREAEAALPPEPELTAEPASPVDFDLPDDPIAAFRVAVGCDGDIEGAFAAIECPDHPRGPRRMARCAELVASACDPGTLAERRDRLAALADEARLLAIVAQTSRMAPAWGTTSPFPC